MKDTYEKIMQYARENDNSELLRAAESLRNLLTGMAPFLSGEAERMVDPEQRIRRQELGDDVSQTIHTQMQMIKEGVERVINGFHVTAERREADAHKDVDARVDAARQEGRDEAYRHAMGPFVRYEDRGERFLNLAGVGHDGFPKSEEEMSLISYLSRE